MRGVILAEDKRTERFFRTLLRKLGWEPRRFTFRTAPAGEGSAEAWVRKQYPAEIQNLRSRNYQRDLCVIAIRDGDDVGVNERLEELAAELESREMDPLSPDERVATPVPTWSIETWLLALLGSDSVTESEPKKREFIRRYAGQERHAIREAVAAWLSESEVGVDPPSLVHGRSEVARVAFP